MAEKYLEKIRKQMAKGHLEKAWQLAEDSLRQGVKSPELEAVSFGLCLALHSWTEVLSRMKQQYRRGVLSALCGDENRQAFVDFVRENPGFRTGLSDYFCSIHAYQEIVDWVRLSDDYDQRWLIETWIDATDQVTVPVKQAALLVAAGIGQLVRGELEQAWQLWIRAIGVDLSLLPKIMTFLQGSKLLDMNSVPNRMQIIRMLLVAGRRKEALQLLLVMGCENGDHALRVLLAIPELFSGDTTHAVLELRFHLALFINDPEILADVISDMRGLSEDQLFQFKKQAVLQLENADLQRQINLYFCKVYMAQDNWEGAALILEGLFIDEPGDDVVDMMGEVLDNYPVLPELNFMVGQYYLESGQIPKAIKYWATVKGVDEFRPKIQRLLEQHLIEGFNEACALMLFDMLYKGSNRAGLLGFWILHHWEEVDQRFLGKMEHGLLHGESGPLWTLALLHGFARAENYSLVLEHLENFLQQYPDLSAEVVRYAEMLAEHYPNDYTSLRRFLRDRSSFLVTGKIWEALLVRFDIVAKDFTQKPSHTHPLPQQPPLATASVLETTGNSEYSAYFEAFQERVMTRNWGAAAELVSKAANREPSWRPAILQQIEQLCQNQPEQWHWLRLRLELLLIDGRLVDAETILSEAIRNPQFKQFLPWLYQRLGETKKTLGHSRDALSAFILASSDADNYKINREIFPGMVKAAGGHQFREVLNLILNAGDEPIWERMIRTWYEEKPGDLSLIVAAQKAFSEKVATPKSCLEFAFWNLQAGRLIDFKKCLKKVDLRQATLAEPLEYLADLANLKYPDDASARFTLGRFYTIHREIPRAVDTFRHLVQSAPDQVEAVYHYLRSYLTNQPESPDRVHLYGLLIRIALDHQLTQPAVRLLDEFSQLDLEEAKRLAEGVNRVLLKDKTANRESLIQFGGLLKKWQEFDRLLELEVQADFGKDMMTERLEWLAAIQSDPSLSSRACLLRARILATRQDFEACRDTVGLITDDAVRGEAVDLYCKLCDRFPLRLELHYEAAWAFQRADHPHAMDMWQRVFEHPEAKSQQIAEAFAAMKEDGQEPDQAVLKRAFNDQEDRMLGCLRDVYARRREIELEVAQEKGESPPEPALAYLLESNQLERFVVWFEKMDHLDPQVCLGLEARHLQRQGYILEAARRVAYSDLPTEFRQSMLRDAGLSALAVVVNPVGERLTAALRSAFAQTIDQPRMLLARYDLMIRNNKKHAIRNAQTIMVNTK